MKSSHRFTPSRSAWPGAFSSSSSTTPLSSILCLALVAFAATTLATTVLAEDEEDDVSSSVEAESPPFATVNGTLISYREYEVELRTSARKKFFHGAPPERVIRQFRIDVGNDLIERALLLQEAKRRDVQPDEAWVKKRFDHFERRYSKRPEWTERPEEAKKAMDELAEGLRHDSQLRVLEENLHAVDPPTEEQLRAYYEAHPEQFTSPDRVRVSNILLGVEPYETGDIWAAKRLEAEKIVFELRNGADFAEQASLYSTDVSADEGGDMGFLHRGILSEDVQEVVDVLALGEVSDPITVLEGITIVRLDEKIEGQLNTLERVRERAGQLWMREEGERVWEEAIRVLHAEAKVEIHDKSYEALLEEAAEDDGASEDGLPVPIMEAAVSSDNAD